MIKNNTFTKDWIQKISNEHKRGKKKADPTLIEKVTKALHLLESLTITDLKFIFKGAVPPLKMNFNNRFEVHL